MPKQHFLYHNKTILVYYRRSPNADTSKDLKLTPHLTFLVSNTVGMHFNTSGPYELNDVKRQITIMRLGEAGNCIANDTQIWFSNHILKFAWYETPAPKWCCILKAQDNNNNLGHEQQPFRKAKKEAGSLLDISSVRCSSCYWSGCFPLLCILHPTSNHHKASPSIAKPKLSACPAKCKSLFPYFL